MKKILIITCGGTIGMVNTDLGFLAPSLGGDQILDNVPEVRGLADIDILDFANIDSTNIQPHHWGEISQVISDRYDDYDGFVLTHGTDTMAYTASALSFSLSNLNKPVVLTGAMKPFDKIPTDATSNLTNAVKVATLDIAEVCIVFGTKIIRGCRATKKGEMTLDAFYSRIVDPIGRVDIEPTLGVYKKISKAYEKLLCLPKFNSNVLYVKIIPGMNPRFLLNDIDACDGIILESTASGNVPTQENSLLPLIEKNHALKKPVVVTVHGYKGGLQINNYEPSYLAMKAGAVPAKDMTAEAAATKLMWALENTESYDELRKVITTNLAGEILE